MRKKKDLKFTKGQANRIADVVIHRYFSKNIGFIVLDGLVHACIENNPQMSFEKFLQYNLKPLIREATRKH